VGDSWASPHNFWPMALEKVNLKKNEKKQNPKANLTNLFLRFPIWNGFVITRFCSTLAASQKIDGQFPERIEFKFERNSAEFHKPLRNFQHKIWALRTMIH